MPAAAWISGSTMTAKISSPCVREQRREAVGRRVVDGARRVQRRPEQRREGGVERIDAPGRDRAERVAVVAVAQPYDVRSPRLTAQLGMPQRELDRHFAGTRAALREEGAGQACGGRREQRIGEGHGSGVREAEERRVRDAVELLADRGVDLRAAMAVHVDPQRRVAVEVPPPALVDQPHALAGRDHERILALPLGLLREGVPEPRAIELGDQGADAGHRRRFCQKRGRSNPQGAGGVKALQAHARSRDARWTTFVRINKLGGTPMKKIVLVLTASALAVSLMTATAGAKRTAAPPTLKPGTLIVGLTPPASGFQVGTLKGTTVVNPKGMEIDLAKAIAAKLGLKKIEWYNQSSFPKSYAPGPKPYDLYFGEETITPERSKNVDYSIPYINADQGAMIRKGLTPVPKSIADLKKLTLCAQAGTTGAAYIKAHIKPAKALYPSTTAIMFQQLVSKQCDASIYDIPIEGSEAASKKPGRYGPIVGRLVTHEQYGIVFQKGSKLRAVVNPVLKGLIKDGTVGKLTKKWLTVNFADLPSFK